MAVKQAAEWSDKVEQILKLFPMHIRKVMEQAEVFQRLSQKLEEIRVRVNQPLELVTADGAYFLNNGALVRQTDQAMSVRIGRRFKADEYPDVSVFALCL